MMSDIHIFGRNVGMYATGHHKLIILQNIMERRNPAEKEWNEKESGGQNLEILSTL